MEFVADLMEIYIMEIGLRGNLRRAMLRRKSVIFKIDNNIVIMENSRMGCKMDSDIANIMMELFILATGNKVLWMGKEYCGIKTGINTLAHLSSPKNQDLGMRKSIILNITDIFKTIKIMVWVLNIAN